MELFGKIINILSLFSQSPNLFGSTIQKMKFSIQDFSSKCDQSQSFLRIWSNLLKKSLLQNYIFCAMLGPKYGSNINFLLFFYYTYDNVVMKSLYHLAFFQSKF